MDTIAEYFDLCATDSAARRRLVESGGRRQGVLCSSQTNRQPYVALLQSAPRLRTVPESTGSARRQHSAGTGLARGVVLSVLLSLLCTWIIDKASVMY